MGKSQVLQWGPNQLRVGPWRGDASVAQVIPAPGMPLSTDIIRRCMDELATQGYRAVLTPALSEPEQAPFVALGFGEHERLHLLRRRVSDPLPESRASVSHRRARRRDRPQVLRVDAAAFSAFWRFDERGLLDARSATPTSRFRVVTDGDIVGYAITGRAGGIAYLQRLAVLPDHQGAGIGTALVLDAFVWARQHHCSSVLVNTQESNENALRLYEHLGFVREPSGLAVLHRDLGDADDVDGAREAG